MDAAKLDAWMKDITPSTELRLWFGHDRERWLNFELEYRNELRGAVLRECVEELREKASKGVVTLLYAAKDDLHNHARILLDTLK